ncbi:MAG TPA: BlaI/MecI/CopY family transcriptional regulator [Phycisphaerae bacterium]|nr:BlaI/MecI/CopY family transcriptional regulator [Phycisphaerae bacterium]
MAESHELSRRERQIMDVVYARGEATADEVHGGLKDAPTRTAVRTFLRILEDKGLLTHEKRGRAFVYWPVRAREKVGKSALRRVLETFFGGSVEKALAAHFADPGTKLTAEEAERLAALIAEARGSSVGEAKGAGRGK